MDTQAYLERIFYSGAFAFTGAKDSIRDVAFLIDNNYLDLSQISIGTHEQYATHVRDISRHESGHDAAGGSTEHVAIKLLARDYLRRIQNAEVLFEQQWCGYFPDAITSDHSYIIECGHTQNPEKILTYVRQENAPVCIQVPYPDPEEEMVYGYEFKAKNELKEFLEFLESERRADIRTILNRKKV